MNLVSGKIALVTSSTRGIGRACAETLAREGAKVYLAVRRPDAGRALAREIAGRGGRADVVLFDADKPETISGMIDEVAFREGRLDILVNNFGTTDVRRDLDIAGTKWDDFMDILSKNIRSVFESVQRAVPLMAKTGGGSIVNISSIGGTVPDMQRTAYGVSKAAVNFLTRDAAVQYARLGIRCNAVLPGYTQTDAAADNMSPEFLSAFLLNVPLGRPGSPQDIAEAVLFLAGDCSSYITGQLLPVAGGFGLPTPLYGMYRASGKRS